MTPLVAHWERYPLRKCARAILPPATKIKGNAHYPAGLLTPAQTAARLACSIKTLNGHVASGALGYVIVGHGKVRPRRMFIPADVDAFIEAQRRKDIPCPSSATSARHISATTTKSKVIAFSAVPRPRPGGKRKP